MYEVDAKPAAFKRQPADSVLKTPKSKQSASAIDYSEDKQAVKVELDVQQ